LGGKKGEEMNAEKLHTVIYDVAEEFKTLNIVGLVTNYVNTFAQNIQQPNPQNSQSFETHRTALQQTLEKATSNHFVPSQQKILNGIGGDACTGIGLFHKLESILEENVLTPGSAIQKLQEHLNKTTEFNTAVQNALNSFKTLGIEFDYPEENEFEVGFLFPCKIFNNDLDGLKKEVNLLNRHLKSISEIAGQDTSSPTIRAVSSGSLELFLNALPETAGLIGDAIQQIASLYLSVLQIRKLRNELKKEKVPKDKLDPLEEYEHEKVKKELEKLTADLFKKYHKGKTENREKELIGHLQKAIEYFANRIDRGVDIEITVPEAQEPEMEEGGDEKEVKKKAEEYKAKLDMQSKGRILVTLERSSEPVLSLPEPEAQEDQE
jgi:hypothetical protein